MRTAEIKNTDTLALLPVVADDDHPPAKKSKARNVRGPIKPGQQLLHRPQVLELLGVGFGTLYAWMREGRFPLPIELGPTGGRNTAMVWFAVEVDEWIASRPRRKFRSLPEPEPEAEPPRRRDQRRPAGRPPRGAPASAVKPERAQAHSPMITEPL
jgi:predicted DNA-binding transcriptional regulator AlpA